MRMSADGMPTDQPSILLTLLSVTLSLSYITAMSDYVLYTVEKSQLSRALTALPYVLMAVLTEFFIRTFSFCSRRQFVNFLALTDHQEPKSQKRVERFMKYFWTVPAVHLACSLAHLIGHGVVHTDTGVSYTTLKSGSTWDRLLALWITFNDFIHDSTVISSLCLVVYSGKRAILSFEIFCEEILKVCQSAADCSASIVQVENHFKAWAPLECVSNKAKTERLIKMFSNVKLAFGLYSQIGGTFIFALVLDQGAWIFYVGCTALFGRPIPGVPFYYVVLTMYCFASIVNLCTIAELGHLMTSKVRLLCE